MCFEGYFEVYWWQIESYVFGGDVVINDFISYFTYWESLSWYLNVEFNY